MKQRHKREAVPVVPLNHKSRNDKSFNSTSQEDVTIQPNGVAHRCSVGCQTRYYITYDGNKMERCSDVGKNGSCSKTLYSSNVITYLVYLSRDIVAENCTTHTGFSFVEVSNFLIDNR